MSLLEANENSRNLDSAGQQVKHTLKQLHGLLSTDQEEVLRRLYIKWVELSSTDFESPETEQKTIDQYFEELIQLGLEKD